MKRRDLKRLLWAGVPLDEFLYAPPEPQAPRPAKPPRPICGAKTRQGRPCIRRAVAGKLRCPNHGGLSTGPKTAEGKARVALNLPWQERPGEP